MAEMKDNGERTQFKTGAERQPTTGKGSFDLFPFLSMTKIAKVLEIGAKKYSRRNYERGMPLSRYLDSGLRHLIQFTLNFKDEEHLSQAIWNFMILQEMKLRIEAGILPEELNDIPSEFFKNVNGFEMFGKMFEPEVKLENFKCRCCDNDTFIKTDILRDSTTRCFTKELIHMVKCSKCDRIAWADKFESSIDNFIKIMNIQIIEPEVKLDKTVVKEVVENAIKTDGEEQFIGDTFGVTKERIAEIEQTAIDKIVKEVVENSKCIGSTFDKDASNYKKPHKDDDKEFPDCSCYYVDIVLINSAEKIPCYGIQCNKCGNPLACGVTSDSVDKYIHCYSKSIVNDIRNDIKVIEQNAIDKGINNNEM